MNALSTAVIAPSADHDSAPGLDLQKIHEGWEHLSEGQRSIIAYLDKPDAEIAAACHVQSSVLPAQLERIFRKLGFHSTLDTRDSRQAAYLIYQINDCGKQPVDAEISLIAFALTGEEKTSRSSLTPAAPESNGHDTKTEHASSNMDPAAFLPNIVNLTIASKTLLMKVATDGLNDEELITEYLKNDRGADIETIYKYFGRVFSALGIPNDTVHYAQRREIAIDVMRLYLERHSKAEAPLNNSPSPPPVAPPPQAASPPPARQKSKSNYLFLRTRNFDLSLLIFEILLEELSAY